MKFSAWLCAWAAPKAAVWAVGLMVLTAVSGAWAASPVDWQLGLQPAATSVAEQMHDFHNLLLWIISLITIFVLGLLVYVMWRFSAKRHPTPSKTSHNTLLEVVWTTVPVVILVVISVYSIKLLYYTAEVQDAELTVKAIGKQWYWSYEYPDNGNFTFDAYPVADEDLEPGQLRLLTTDEVVVIPSETKIRFLVTAGDVLHAFAMPAFGIKTDAIPGRVNETWAKIPASFDGQTFYGQCSEICGTGHAFMPIMIKVVSREDYGKWVDEALARFARVDEPLEQEQDEAAVQLAGRERPVVKSGEGE